MRCALYLIDGASLGHTPDAQRGRCALGWQHAEWTMNYTVVSYVTSKKDSNKSLSPQASWPPPSPVAHTTAVHSHAIIRRGDVDGAITHLQVHTPDPRLGRLAVHTERATARLYEEEDGSCMNDDNTDTAGGNEPSPYCTHNKTHRQRETHTHTHTHTHTWRTFGFTTQGRQRDSLIRWYD